MNLTDEEIRMLANVATLAIQGEPAEPCTAEEQEALESARDKLVIEEFRREAMNTKKARASKKAK